MPDRRCVARSSHPVRSSRPLTAITLSLILACGAPPTNVPAPGTNLIVPPASALTPPTVRDTTRHYHVLGRRQSDSVERDLALIAVAERRQADRSGAAILQVMGSPQWQWDDTVLARAKGLAPRWERLRVGRHIIRLEYDGGRVTRWEQNGDSAARTSTVTFPTAVFAFNQVHMIVRSLPLRVGYTAILPLYSEMTAELERDTVSVTAAPSAGKLDWTIRFADPAIVSTYRLDAVTREIVDYRVVQRAAKAEMRWVAATE